MKKNNFKITDFPALGLMVILGGIFRMMVLIQKNIWFDEALTFYFSRLPVISLIKAVLLDSNPPLYYLMIHFWLKFGNSDIFLRLPSLIFNLAVIPVIYMLGKKIINAKTGLMAALLFTVSPLSIYLSTEARLHGLALILITLTVLKFFDLLNNPSGKNICLFLVFLIPALYTHYYSLLCLPALTLIVYYKKTKLKILLWFKILLAAFILYLPWIIPVFLNPHNQCNCPNAVLALPSVLVSPAVGGIGEITLRQYLKLSKELQFLCGISGVLSGYLFFRGIKKHLIFSLIYLVPLLFLSISGLFFPVFSPKAFAVFSPVFFLILAAGIYQSYRPRTVFFIIIGLYLTVNLVQMKNPLFTGTLVKPYLLNINSQPGLTIAHTSSMTYYPWSFYTQDNNRNILLTANPYSAALLKYLPGEKQKIEISEDKFWLIDAPDLVNINERQQVLTELSFNYYKIINYPAPNITLSLWLRKKP